MHGQHSQPFPTSLGRGCVRVYQGCNLPPALLSERLGSFTCHCGNTGEWERATLRTSHHRELTLNSPTGACRDSDKPTTFRSQGRCSTDRAVPTCQSDQTAWNTPKCDKVFSDELRVSSFPDRFPPPTLCQDSGHSQPTPTSLGQRCMHV